MATDNNQEKQQKPQSNRNGKLITNEATKKSVDAGGFKRSKKGTASDTTGSTGPRKK